MDDEIPLAGGRTQQVVRIGDTVRRRPHANHLFVRALLRQLEDADFDAVPRWLGSDAQGREIFSFVEGSVPRDLGHHDDDRLRAAAALIRHFHDAIAAFRASDMAACHNDLSPCNFVFREGMPAAIIDFDTAAPGARLDDLGYAAWTWLDLGNEDYELAEQARRCGLFAAAYDADTVPLDMVGAALARQRQMMDHDPRPEVAAWARVCHAVTAQLLRLMAGA